MKEDHEQLVTQYEREKCHRKNAEQRLLEVEFSNDEERNELQSKVGVTTFPCSKIPFSAYYENIITLSVDLNLSET